MALRLKMPLDKLRLIGHIEGTSFLLLLLVAMPLKYLAGMPEAVFYVGSAHGALWVIYVLALFVAYFQHRWPFRRLIEGGIASVLPFGPWVFDARLQREAASATD